MEKEQWKVITGYDNYEVSTWGNVRNVKTGKIITQFVNSKGYMKVTLSKNSKKKCFRVHRLVALAFIPNPHNYSDVNHKDKNRQNNHVDNLEWLPHDEHLQQNKGKKVRCIETGQEFDSIQQASREMGINQGNLVSHLKGRLKSIKGLHFEFVD